MPFNRNRFQYHKGAIISSLKHSGNMSSLPFQYHKGAIISASFHATVEVYLRFQYHKGAIISQRLKEQNQLFLGNFKRFSGTCQDHNVVDLQFTLKPRLIDDLI